MEKYVYRFVNKITFTGMPENDVILFSRFTILLTRPSGLSTNSESLLTVAVNGLMNVFVKLLTLFDAFSI